MKFNFADRVPDILLESFFIVSALLLALALDQWRDDRKTLEQAELAKTAIYKELRDNKKKLDDKRIIHQKILDNINQYIESKSKETDESKSMEFEYAMVLIASSAWNSAKMTQAVQSFSFKEITNFSQIYQMQELYLANQNKIIDKVMQMGELDDTEMLGFAKGIAHRLKILIDISDSFSKGLAGTIATEKIKQQPAN